MGTVPSALKHCLSYQHLLKEQLWIAEPPAAAHPAQHPTSWQRIGHGLQLLLEPAAASVRQSPVPENSFFEELSEQQFC